MDGEHCHDGAGDLVLDRKDVLDLAVVALGPAMGPGDGVDELGGDADATTSGQTALLSSSLVMMRPECSRR
jgi:hypothetical protein